MSNLKFIMLSILIVYSLSDGDKIKGYSNCGKLYQETIEKVFKSNDKPNITINGVSDCIDASGDATKEYGQYWENCCYVRFFYNGYQHKGCLGLNSNDLDDIKHTRKFAEKGERDIMDVEKGKWATIYELDCKSSYIKIGLLLGFIAFLF